MELIRAAPPTEPSVSGAIAKCWFGMCFANAGKVNAAGVARLNVK